MKIYYKFFILFVFLATTTSVVSEASTQLNRRTKINNHIKKKLDNKIRKIINDKHYKLVVRVTSRNREVVQQKQIHLGKLGHQTIKKNKKNKYEKKPLIERLTNVDVVLFFHPIVESSEIKQIKKLIYNQNLFVSRRNVNIIQYQMPAYPQYFSGNNIIEDFKYWYKLNKELGDSIIKYSSLSGLIILLFSFTWLMFYMRAKRFESSVLASINNLNENPAESVKNISKEEVHKSPGEVIYLADRIAEDRVKFFFNVSDSENEFKKTN
ncbi:MAG: hypothetical protein KC493_13850 [Bacteriovoracaceae bacterium]|nr:hypothetical protein [Bacteriovoracaceae bacterium]